MGDSNGIGFVLFTIVIVVLLAGQIKTQNVSEELSMDLCNTQDYLECKLVEQNCYWCTSCKAECEEESSINIVRINPTSGYSDEAINLTLYFDIILAEMFSYEISVANQVCDNPMVEENKNLRCILSPPFKEIKSTVQVIIKNNKTRKQVTVESLDEAQMVLLGRKIIDYLPRYMFHSCKGYIELQVDKVDFPMAAIYIGNQRCTTSELLESKNKIKCVIPPMKPISLQSERSVNLVLQVPGKEFRTRPDFKIRPDPRIADLSPRTIYPNIPITIVFRGDGFNSFYQPTMYFVDKMNAVNCTQSTRTELFCPTPTIRIQGATSMPKLVKINLTLTSHSSLVPDKLFTTNRTVNLSPRPKFKIVRYVAAQRELQFEATNFLTAYDGTIEVYKQSGHVIGCTSRIRKHSDFIYSCDLYMEDTVIHDYLSRFVVRFGGKSYNIEMGQVLFGSSMITNSAAVAVGVSFLFLVIISAMAISVLSKKFREKLLSYPSVITSRSMTIRSKTDISKEPFKDKKTKSTPHFPTKAQIDFKEKQKPIGSYDTFQSESETFATQEYGSNIY